MFSVIPQNQPPPDGSALTISGVVLALLMLLVPQVAPRVIKLIDSFLEERQLRMKNYRDISAQLKEANDQYLKYQEWATEQINSITEKSNQALERVAQIQNTQEDDRREREDKDRRYEEALAAQVKTNQELEHKLNTITLTHADALQSLQSEITIRMVSEGARDTAIRERDALRREKNDLEKKVNGLQDQINSLQAEVNTLKANQNNNQGAP